MSINKVALSVALAGILGASSALAETDGVFAGVQFGFGGANAKSEYAVVATDSGVSFGADATKSASSFRYGFLAGYKQFFTEKFGLRYYGVIDFGTQSEHKIGPSYNADGASPVEAYFNFTETIKISTLNLNANVDALYNFKQNDSFEFGVFGGLSLGYTSYKAQSVAINGVNRTFSTFTYSYKDLSASGFDFGINFGLRANIAQKHGVELYSRFSLLKQKDDYKYALDEAQTIVLTNFEAKQPYAVGLRYSFSF